MAVCSCPYEYNEDKMQLRFNCMGSLYGSSVEDFPECFGRVIDAILENKKVQSVVLAREREYEYDYPQVKMLVEIADIIDFAMRERLIDYSRMGSEECRRCYPDWSKELQRIVFDLLRRDPVGAYVEVLREARTVSAKMKRAASRACYNCLRAYNRDVLGVLRERLEATELIKRAKPRVYGYHVGERSPYRQIFMPSTRPNFMFTRYMITPPEGGHSVDRYKVEDSQIEIYKLPDVAQYLYYILPPEFRLSEERYAVLDAARRYMAAHRPTTAEFVKSERVRDIFFNIGRDTIRETADKMGISLGAKDVKQLADILTRYTAGFGVLELLLADEKIQDMYINSPIESQPILVYHQDWGECKTNLIPTREDAEAWATRLRILSGRPLDEANPVLDVDIAVPGGKARFAVITRTLSPEGLGFAVRRHRYKPWTLPLFIKNKMINPLTAGLLSFLIDGNAAMIVAGGRSAGKTSLLAALMLEILPKVRIVTIEDSVTGDAEIVFEKNGKVRRGAVGELIDGLIEKHGKRFAGREVVDMNPEDIKVFSINSLGKVELAPVSKFIRHKVRKDIHMVKTRTGKTIKVTGDHSLFTLGEYGEVKPIEVRKLKKGDYIVTPRCLPLGSRKRGLLDVLKDLQIKNAYLIGSGIGKAIGLDRE
ncbi:MAG: ATPase, T2SS/T4P/T4SS family, partial [Candidatus Aenigmatarchaeota archaeon]